MNSLESFRREVADAKPHFEKLAKRMYELVADEGSGDAVEDRVERMEKVWADAGLEHAIPLVRLYSLSYGLLTR